MMKNLKTTTKTNSNLLKEIAVNEAKNIKSLETKVLLNLLFIFFKLFLKDVYLWNV